MRVQVVLTVAESKRLIARGIAAHPAVRAALEQGIVAVAKGSTNAYIVEELTGRKIEKNHYVTGHTLPARAGEELKKSINASLSDCVLRRGALVPGLTVAAAVAEMGPGDVFLKGANALDYERRQAAVLIGHPTGGTLGATLGTIIARRIRLLIPVGLEKAVPGDLALAARLVNEAPALDEEPPPDVPRPALWLLNGEVFTEIEALATLCGVEAVPIAAGGIGGAEGAVRLLVSGDKPAVAQALALVREIQGEAAFPG